MAAVSVRKMRGPKSICSHPAWIAWFTSSSVKPPSGPTAATTPDEAAPAARSLWIASAALLGLFGAEVATGQTGNG